MHEDQHTSIINALLWSRFQERLKADSACVKQSNLSDGLSALQHVSYHIAVVIEFFAICIHICAFDFDIFGTGPTGLLAPCRNERILKYNIYNFLFIDMYS